MKYYILFLTIGLLVWSCKDSNCSFKYTDSNKTTFTGCLQDSLENGLWTVSDSAGKIVETVFCNAAG